MTRTYDPSPHPADALLVVRCRNTHRYFTGEDWNEDPHHAEPFPNEVDATRACAIHGLQDVELVLCSPATGSEISSTTHEVNTPSACSIPRPASPPEGHGK